MSEMHENESQNKNEDSGNMKWDDFNTVGGPKYGLCS